MTDKQQFAKELHKPAKQKFKRRKIKTFFPNDIWAADLVDVSDISKKNKGIHFLLNIIDIYSRYAFSFPLKSKHASNILNTFKSLKTLPVNLWVDEGTEFYNKDFKKFCKDNGINMYHTNSGLKSVYVERFNRTLKETMYRYFTENDTEKYLDKLPEFIDNYNNTVHSKIGWTPKEVYDGDVKVEDEKEPELKSSKFKVGDFVRISKVKQTFEKGYTQRWSKEVFEIYKIDNYDNPSLYYLKDLKGEVIEGKFYENELQKTDLKDFALIKKVLKTKIENHKKMYLVEYDGYDSKFNNWLSKDEIDKNLFKL